MAANKYKFLFVCILGVLSSANSLHLAFSEEQALDLSGKYKGYNVVLIVLDALRADHLSCYGYPKKTSPNIDALAKQGVLFTNAFSQASYTIASVTSIFTSVYPYSHGVRYVSKDKVPDKLYTLAQILGLYGYKTAWFGKINDPHSGSAPGLMKGFDEKYDEETPQQAQTRYSWIKKHRQEPFFITIHSYLSHENTFPFTEFDNKFSRFIPKHFWDSLIGMKKKRWLAFQNIIMHDTKRPAGLFGQDWLLKNKRYLISPYSNNAFEGLFSLIQNSKQERFLVRMNTDITNGFFGSFNNKQISWFKSLFDSAIYEIDTKIIAELVGKLKEEGIYEKTIIIITADHGNEFKEHGMFGHGQALYDESIHVPLIFYIPHLNKSVVSKELVESIDILPTTLDLLSIPIPAQAQGTNLRGLIEGKNDALGKKYIFSQIAPMGSFSVRSKDWKFIKTAESPGMRPGNFNESLFYLKKDPHELHNVIKDYPQIGRQFKSRLDEWMKGLAVYNESDSEFTPGLDEETIKRIKKTGYW